MREKYSAAAKARWADPIEGARLRAAIRSTASRAKMSEASKARWADPVARENMIAKFRASSADPAVREKLASASKKRWADPQMREKIIAGMRATPKPFSAIVNTGSARFQERSYRTSSAMGSDG